MIVLTSSKSCQASAMFECICTHQFNFLFFSLYHLQWLPSQDDERLATIKSEYSKGAMLTGEVKKELIGILQVR